MIDMKGAGSRDADSLLNGNSAGSISNSTDGLTARAIVAPPYDYSAIEPDLATKLKAKAERIRECVGKTLADIIDIGRDLVAAKDSLPHGQFLPWVQSEVGISAATAQRWMRVARLHTAPDAFDAGTRIPADREGRDSRRDQHRDHKGGSRRSGLNLRSQGDDLAGPGSA